MRFWVSVFSEFLNYLCIPLLGVSYVHEPRLVFSSRSCWSFQFLEVLLLPDFLLHLLGFSHVYMSFKVWHTLDH